MKNHRKGNTRNALASDALNSEIWREEASQLKVMIDGAVQIFPEEGASL